MKKIIAISCGLFGLALVSFGQNVVLEQDVNKDTVQQTSGPNLKNFSQFYVGYGLIAGESDGFGADIKYGTSSYGTFGLRYKRKITEHYAIGYELNYNVYAFKLKDTEDKIFPTGIRYDKEKLVLHNFGLGLYNRFNFGRRGNHLGKYLDLGGYGDYAFDSKYVFRTSADSVNVFGAKKQRVAMKDLQYLRKLNYGVTARFGINRFVFFGNYRLSDLFKDAYQQRVDNLAGYAELPRMVFGLQIGLN